MARYMFGGGVADWTLSTVTVSTVPNVAQVTGGVTVTFWSAETAGNQYTDLLDSDGAAVSAIASADGSIVRAAGQIPPFWGPDGVAEMWASANGGPRSRMLAMETPAGAQAKADAAVAASAQRAAAGRKYGRLPSRSDYARLAGRSSTFGTVTTNLTSGAQAVIPLNEPADRSTILLSGGAAVVPPVFAYGQYDITYRVAFTGGTVGTREARLLVDGVQVHVTRGYGIDVTVEGSLRRSLNAGQTVSLAAYTGSSGASVIADGVNGVLLTVEAFPARKVEPSLVGWSWTADIDGMDSRDIYGTFLDRNSWSNLAAPLGTGTTFDTWVAANRSRAAEITGPLVPTLMPGIVLDTALDEVTAGTRDAAFTALGAALAQYGPDTVYYRMFHEMNYTSLYPMTVAKFLAAWNHAVPIIRSGFASAARAGQTLSIVWCFGGDSVDPSPFFPAAANVDVVSVDTYLKKYNAPATPNNVFDIVRTDLARVTNIAAANSKPAAISEWANVAVGPATNLWNGLGDWVYGIDYIFDAIERNGLIYSLYFNNGGGGVGQTMADIPLSRARFIERANLIRPAA